MLEVEIFLTWSRAFATTGRKAHRGSSAIVRDALLRVSYIVVCRIPMTGVDLFKCTFATCSAVWGYWGFPGWRSDFSKNLAEGQAAEDAAVEAYAPDLVCDKLR